MIRTLPDEQAAEAQQRGDAFYVSVIDGQRSGLLVGPFTTHAEACSWVEPTRQWVTARWAWAHFWEFGTCSARVPAVEAPPAQLNLILGYTPPGAAGLLSATLTNPERIDRCPSSPPRPPGASPATSCAWNGSSTTSASATSPKKKWTPDSTRRPDDMEPVTPLDAELDRIYAQTRDDALRAVANLDYAGRKMALYQAARQADDEFCAVPADPDTVASGDHARANARRIGALAAEAINHAHNLDPLMLDDNERRARDFGLSLTDCGYSDAMRRIGAAQQLP